MPLSYLLTASDVRFADFSAMVVVDQSSRVIQICEIDFRVGNERNTIPCKKPVLLDEGKKWGFCVGPPGRDWPLV